MSRRRVVITGLGTVSPLGLKMQETWDNLLQGISGASEVTSFDASEHGTKFACTVSNFEPEQHFSKLEARRYDPFTQFLLAAGDEAVADSGLDMATEDPQRAGCIVGTGIGGIIELERTKEVAMAKGVRRVSPFFIPKMIANSGAGQAAIRFNLQGTSFSTVSACASSGHAIAMAARAIQWGEAEIILTGGSEAATSSLGMAGFSAMKALSVRNDDPKRASRPFDKTRDGFVMGEGSTCLVLEELEHARARGARIYAEFVGYGSTDDAHHITAPKEDGSGPMRAMQLALQDGCLNPEDVDYVNAHGTSTQLNDRIETLALKHVFGDRAYKVPVSSIKSMVGHLLGASGAIELAVSAKTICEGKIPPTINYEVPDPDCDLDYVPNEARESDVKVVISNSLGFGGHNTCLAIQRFEG
ncbi:MAG: beta-ketoacyl-ACP synthase II [Planctomycetota bacterium]|nr:beta-ketoacyl-ACP synthase II [Planctomycetota bacterium]